ncbi:hypothetical protein NC651_026859 [Populus alba x Populus x berolinensis]|nr:hypothetical protein NC651_026859 [Populus alba x Populus x berolinensis]
MANLPQSLSINTPFGGPSASNTAAVAPANKDRKMASAEHLVLDLSNPDLRENALLELSKNKDLFQDLAPFVWNSFGTIAALIQKRELFQDLAPLLWNSFGTIAALLQEIVSIYPVLSPPNLSPAQSNRVCNALALLQCVASHPNTRMLFLNGNVLNLVCSLERKLYYCWLDPHIPLYLYPFLNTTSKSRPFEYLRLTSLGVIGALVKVATFIVQKILLDDVGLDYICTTAERFFAVGRVLGNMVAALAEQPSSRLLKHIIRCYLRLSDNPRACHALRSCLPDMLRDATFSSCLREDPTTRRWLQQLLHNVGGNRVPGLQAGGGFDHMLGHLLVFYHVAWVRKKTEESSTNRDHDSGNCQHIWDLYWLSLSDPGTSSDRVRTTTYLELVPDDTLNFSAKFQSFCAASIRRSNGKVAHCLTCLAKTISDELGVTMNAVASAHLDGSGTELDSTGYIGGVTEQDCLHQKKDTVDGDKSWLEDEGSGSIVENWRPKRLPTIA